ncbi:class II aldolase/adducin family protein [Saccharicrinis fermentans]|uniref:L-fuculose phosphate aldolase n=1 Tax=Saccharicrinis fermentans DSM 9555 = JCM 21142 TaxID=869213 RepID=W7Y1X4_9BACT|nr:class II aldolase/adducin family protein [Saccharicrinis fermentans]GAF01952.1 L-fuculose phosphate aldolase [Saccharicrinis fermentans DSM 9555 = JCM 21142]
MSVRNLNLLHPRDQIIMIINRIYQKGLTTTSGGNISIMDESGDMWVTPSGVDKGSLKPSDIMCVKADGTMVGPHKPSMEYPFHKAIYSERPDIKSVVHAHPPALVAFSIVRQIPNTNVIPQVKQVCGPIGYAKYAIPGSSDLGDSISEQFQKGFDSVIMENHGAVVGGKNVIKAYERFETLEFACRTLINSKIIGEPQFLTEEQIFGFNNQIPTDHPKMETVTHTSDEKELRQQIKDMVRRACDQGLMMSTYGTISVRWKGNDFLITPTDATRWDLQANDIVQVKGGLCEPNKVPSRSTWLHQKIYEMNPEINAIILTQPEYLMAYGVAHKKVDVRTIPESWIFLQDMENVPFGSHFLSNDTIPQKVSAANPGVIIENDSVLMTGNSLLQAFDRLEVAEFSAKSLVMGTSLGAFAPMNENEIDDLRKAFF